LARAKALHTGCDWPIAQAYSAEGQPSVVVMRLGLLLGQSLLLYFFMIGSSSSEEDVFVSWSRVFVSLNANQRPILQIGSPGQLFKGRITAVLGPSGAGKSTFLSLLAGRISSSSSAMTAGPLRVISDISPQWSGSDVAFVYQDDSFFSMLTVLETLRLTSSLRLVNQTTHEREKAVEEVMSAMSLTAVGDIAVGDVGKRGISGGERKRLAVACELLSKPKLLIADEPSSGLDAFQAFSVVQQLKNTVVRLNIAGVVTLHQPRSSIWALLDDVILLAANGRLVYHGSRKGAVEYFARQGFPCPANTNPAEHLIDLVSVDNTSPETRRQSVERIDKLVKVFQSTHPQTSSVNKETKKNADGGAAVSLSKKRGSIADLIVDSGRLVRRFALLLQRALRQTIRDSGVNFVRLGVSAVLASVVGAVYGKMPSGDIDEDSVGDRVTIVAQAAIQVSMLAMLKTLQLFKRERVVVMREIATRQYGSFEYLASKCVAELPVDALVAAFFGLVLHQRTNLRCDRNEFVATLSLLGCASSSLGLAISALAPTADIALAVGPALMVVYVIAGSIGPGKAKIDVSWLLRGLRSASPIRPACESICVAEFAGQNFATPRRANFFSHIGRVVRHLFSSSILHPNRRSRLPGDLVLQDLGLQHSSVARGKQSLLLMIGVHTALALIGLLVSNLNEQL